MKTGVLFLIFGFISAALSQTVTLTGVALAGGSSRTGRLEATIVTTTGPVAVTTTTTVCGSIDLSTAFVVCSNLGFIAPINWGTVGALSVPQGSGVIQIRNLNCTGGSLDLSSCRFSQAIISTCTHANDVAIDCSVTPGEAVGITIGLLAFLALVIGVPIIICLCCCCGLCATISCFSGRRRVGHRKF